MSPAWLTPFFLKKLFSIVAEVALTWKVTENHQETVKEMAVMGGGDTYVRVSQCPQCPDGF